MANEEHLAQLLEGVDAWNAWRQANPYVRPNLYGVNLPGFDLSKADLTDTYLGEATFSGAILSGANFGSAYLRGANFRNACLTGTIFSEAGLMWADLTEANLSGAHLTEANLNTANLNAADLSEAVLGETVFADVNLESTRGLDTCKHIGPSIIDHRTLERFGPKLPPNFLRGVGLPETLIDYIPSIFGRAIEFYSCFISYSHADKSFARRLYDQLQGRGIRCWLDEKQLLPGDAVLDAIDRGIKLWDKVLLCCSEAALKGSPWVDREVDKALEKEERLWRERDEKVLALIPLNLDGYLFRWDGGQASVLRSRFVPDFTGWEHDNAKFEQQFEQVVKALRTGEGGRERPPEPRL